MHGHTNIKYHHSPRNDPEERGSQLLRDGSLTSHNLRHYNKGVRVSCTCLWDVQMCWISGLDRGDNTFRYNFGKKNGTSTS